MVGRQLSRAWEPGLISGTAGRAQRLHKLGVNQFWYAAELYRSLPLRAVGCSLRGLPLGSREATSFQLVFVRLSEEKFPKKIKNWWTAAARRRGSARRICRASLTPKGQGRSSPYESSKKAPSGSNDADSDNPCVIIVPTTMCPACHGDSRFCIKSGRFWAADRFCGFQPFRICQRILLLPINTFNDLQTT